MPERWTPRPAVQPPVDARRVGRDAQEELAAGRDDDPLAREREVPHLGDRERHAFREFRRASCAEIVSRYRPGFAHELALRVLDLPVPDELPVIFWPWVKSTWRPRTARIACAGSLTL